MNPREQQTMNETLASLQHRGDTFTRAMLHSQLKVTQLASAIKEADLLITTNRNRTKQKAISLLNLHSLTPNDAYQRADGLNPTKLADVNQKKLVGNLESRLNKALIRHSEVVNKNEQIKEQINKMRHKRSNDDHNRLTLSKKLSKIQSDMDLLMSTGALQSSQRDLATERKNELLESNLDEGEEFGKEMKRMGGFVEEQNRMLEESIMTAAKAVKFDDNFDGDGENGSNQIEDAGKLTVDHEKEIKLKLTEITQSMDAGKQQLRVMEDKIKLYQKNFVDLREVSGLVDIDDIVSVFVKNEEETFSLFNFIQTVNQETDVTLEQHARLEEEILVYANDQKDQESKRRSVVESYNAQVEDAVEERNKMSVLSLDEQKTVEKIAKKVQTLFYKIQCDQLLEGGAKGGKGNSSSAVSSESRLAVLSGQGVSESNILHFMGLIEERAVQVVGEYVRRLAQTKEGRRPSISYGKKEYDKAKLSMNSTGKPKNLDIDESDESEDESELRPMSLEEMRRRAGEKVNYKNRKGRRGGKNSMNSIK